MWNIFVRGLKSDETWLRILKSKEIISIVGKFIEKALVHIFWTLACSQRRFKIWIDIINNTRIKTCFVHRRG
ncbi:hypothetical protein BK123_25895 [Paenibacillus lautus]|uniref:Uncharacterized protein n=1 Tax=Paenibacillus lautus TaxID=1401 RepID=A0A1R1AW43_PAELA|nr:hypothetical protein BK123_25895 [Paenibacillus lautus]